MNDNFWFNVCIGFGVACLILVMTPPIAFLFGKYLSKGIKDSNSKEQP